MHFAVDPLATGILLGGLLLFVLLKRFAFPQHPNRHEQQPSLGFSRLSDLKFSSWRSRLTSFPKRLHTAALLAFMVAFIDPHFLFMKEPLSHQHNQPARELPTEGIAIYLALDRSGSMAQPVKITGSLGQTVSVPKIDLLKQVTKEFILENPSDLIGLASFARIPKILVPLTLDQETLIRQLDKIQVVKDPQDDGTAIGYAIFKTANLIAATKHFMQDLRQGGNPPFTIKSAVIIVVTDGFQDPSRLDQGNRLRTLELDDAAAYVKSQGIRLYVVDIDPALATSEYAPQRRQLQKITAQTGGKYYLVDDNQDLQAIYTDINQLEKGAIYQEARQQSLQSQTQYSRFSLYPFFIFLGLGCLLAALLLESYVLKEVP